MKNVTAFGKWMRKYRIEHNEKLRDMARKLDTSPAYLSAIELGKVSIPKLVYDKLYMQYNFTEEERRELIRVISETKGSVNISLNLNDDYRKDTVLKFVYLLNSMSKEDAERLCALFDSMDHADTVSEQQ